MQAKETEMEKMTSLADKIHALLGEILPLVNVNVQRSNRYKLVKFFLKFAAFKMQN